MRDLFLLRQCNFEPPIFQSQAQAKSDSVIEFLQAFHVSLDDVNNTANELVSFSVNWVSLVIHMTHIAKHDISRYTYIKHFDVVSSILLLFDAVITTHDHLHADIIQLSNTGSTDFEQCRKLMHLKDQFIVLGCKSLDRVVHHQTLPIKDCRIFEAGFFAPLATVKKPLTHILSKVINIRCQARKFSTVLRKYMQAIQKKKLTANQKAESKMNDDHPMVICQTLKTLFICSLLGNYPHVDPKHRATAPTRIAMYMFLHKKETSSWFHNVLEHCSLLIINALRDYLIYAIHCHQELERRLDVLMNLTMFQNIVDKNMSFVRDYLNQVLRIRSSSAYRSLSDSRNKLAMRTVLRDFNQLMHQSHAAILAISYRRPNLPFCQFLLSCRKRGFLIQIPNTKNLPNTNHNQLTIMGKKRKRKQAPQPVPGANSCSEHALKRSRTNDSICQPQSFTATNPVVLKDLQKNIIGDEEDEDCGIRNLFDFIDVKQYELLHLLVLNHNPFSQNVITEILPYFESFGIDQRTIQFIAHQIYLYNHNGSSTEQIKSQIYQLRINQPHAYNLLQITADIIRQKQRHYTLYDLPTHITNNQLKAAQTRYEPFIQDSAVLHNFLHFVYCRVCGAVYSLLREYNAVYKRLYKYGLRDVVSSYIDDSIYCGRGRTSHIGECQSMPLQKVPILGQVISFHGKQIMLCPQPKCCKPMVFHPEHMIFNEYGPMCKDCIDHLVEINQEFQDLQNKYKPEDFKAPQPTAITCDLCGVVMEKQTKMHCFIKDIHICKNHSIPFYSKQIAEAARQNPDYTREDFILNYSKFIKDRFDFKQAIMKDYHARQASKASLKARSRRR